jgi:LuxR family maltose regulon positive regulatory protein
MPDSLVETKFLVPRPRATAVERARLDDLVQRGATATLTLVAAPAGFGKTTLLGGWLATARGDQRTAWVSLDERDRDADTFWTYVLHAVDRAAPGSASGALDALQSRRAGIEAVLTQLLNELSVLPGDLSLVLDDYHLAEGPDIQAGVSFLLDHLPPQVHLVISTRVDPALPLGRLRARGDLVEVRADDLRFTESEAAAYLNHACDLGLARSDVAALEARTEGWVAALQLAALSLDGRPDPSKFIAGFAGDDRFVVDYLADEVLDRHPPPERRFLLDTSVLEELSGPLCDAVTGRTDSGLMLQSLERQNLFLVPLDRNRRRYRYHHLFRDVLSARLVDERPAEVADLHRRASDWYDDVGDPQGAVRHALAAGDVNLAAQRVELAIPGLLRERREDVVRRWVDELPDGVASNRPVLAVGLIGGLMASNVFDGVRQRLRDVERMLVATGTKGAGLVVYDRNELERLPAAVETYHAALALVSGDTPGTVEHARKALALAAENDHLSHAAASALLGLVAWGEGDLEAAHRGYRDASQHLRQAGSGADVVGCAITIADIELTQGKLDDAHHTFTDALALAVGDYAPLRGTADMYVGLSRVAYARGDLTVMADYLRRADELGDAAGLPMNPYRWRVAMALLRAAEGDMQTAVSLLDEAERVYVADFAPNVAPISATRARVQAVAGDLAPAREWVRGRRLSPLDELSYLHEYEYLTLARILLVQARTGSVGEGHSDLTLLLDRLVEATESGGRIGHHIEALVLQALARQVTGSQQRATEPMAKAVELAARQGHVQVFTGVGQALRTPMLQLLSALARQQPGSHFLQGLLRREPGIRAEPTMVGGSDVQPLVDPLSSRELDVLRLLRSDLDGPAIARELSVSLATVRTHTQHIYLKLGVNNRRAAVRRAHQLNLLSRAPRR